MSKPFNGNSTVTYNPASKLFQYEDDLLKRAADHSYKAYYNALSKQAHSPCSAIFQPAKESVVINMRHKGYDEKVIDSYATNIAKELVKKCEKHIFHVQHLAGLYNDSVKARLAGGTRRRRQTRYDVSRRARRKRASASNSGI